MVNTMAVMRETTICKNPGRPVPVVDFVRMEPQQT